MRRKKITVAQPNDLAFLLIIFFILLVGVYGIHSINLSTSSKETNKNDSIAILINLDANGSIWYKDTFLSEEKFNQLLQNVKTARLQIAGEAEWQDVITVLSTLDERNITVALEQSP